MPLRGCTHAPVHPGVSQSDKDSREDIQKVFNLFDDDATGKISLKNLKRVAKELGETMTGATRGCMRRLVAWRSWRCSLVVV